MDGILTYVLIILLSVSYFNEFLTECYIFINLVETMVGFVIRFCLFLCIMTFSLPKHKRTTPVRRSSFMIGMYQTVRQIGIWLTEGFHHNRQPITCFFSVFNISTIRPKFLCRPISRHITVIYTLFAKATFYIQNQLFAVAFCTI